MSLDATLNVSCHILLNTFVVVLKGHIVPACDYSEIGLVKPFKINVSII